MKCFLLLLFVFVTKFSFNQEQFQVSPLSSFDAPLKSKTPYFNNSLGLGYELSFKPVSTLPMYIDFENSYSFNSILHLNRSKLIYFQDITPFTHTYSVNYITHFNKFLLGVKWVIGNDYRNFNAFLTPQIGFVNFNATYSYDDVQNPYWSNSRQNDYDEDDVQFHSHRDKFFRSNIFVFGGNSGISLNMNDLFSMNSKLRQRLFFRASFYMSGFNKFRYTNMNYALDESHHNEIISRDIYYQNLPNNSNTNEVGKYPIITNQLMIWGIQVGYTIVF